MTHHKIHPALAHSSCIPHPRTYYLPWTIRPLNMCSKQAFSTPTLYEEHRESLQSYGWRGWLFGSRHLHEHCHSIGMVMLFLPSSVCHLSTLSVTFFFFIHCPALISISILIYRLAKIFKEDLKFSLLMVIALNILWQAKEKSRPPPWSLWINNLLLNRLWVEK